jgi:Mrp family chromosome partitioning ATPase
MSAIDQAFIRAYEVDDDATPARAAATHAPAQTRRPAQPSTPSHAGPSAPHYHFDAEPAPQPSAPALTHAAHRSAPASPLQRAGAPPYSPAPATQAAPPNERRPLSSFAPPRPTVEARFRPEFEVDAFRWPTISNALIAHGADAWNAALETLLAADASGCSLIGVAGSARGVGATTIVGCLARLLVASDKTVAIVDGNFAAPNLAGSLGLAADLGWEDVLAGRAPLADAVIHSLNDRIALLPLLAGGAHAAEKLDAIHASVTAGVLRYHYDIVLFDLGALADPTQAANACRIARRCRLDGMLLATAPSAAPASAARIAQLAPELAQVCLGVIENQILTK